MKLARIQIDNFLGVHHIDARLITPVTLFAGPNGAAKSSIGEAVRMAVTGATVRVKLKNEYDQLVTDGATAGGALITIDDERTYAFNIPGGKVTADDGLPTGGAVAVALNGQQFSSMPADERRTFLYQLTGIRAKADDIKERMIKRECDAAKIETTLPLLRTGFPDACQFAEKKATDAKGAWRGITGGVWGKNKSEGWAAPLPEDLAGYVPTGEELAQLDTDIAAANQQVGQVAAQVRAQTESAAKRAALKAKAEGVKRVTEALEHARKQLAEYEPQVIAVRERAGGTKRVGLVHDFAVFVDNFTAENEDDAEDAAALLDRYKAEYGEIVEAGNVDQDAKNSLPEYERGLEVMQNGVRNLERDLAAAIEAKGQYDALAAPEKAEPLPDLAVLQAALKQLQEQRAAMQAKINAAVGHVAAVDAAKKKTADAAKHHADVMSWLVVAEALAPNGIPGDLLKEALLPVNKMLTEEAEAANWKNICISSDMEITAAGRAYALLSESEKWRTDAMIAVVVARLSGLKILMLDRVDVLDLPGRSALLGWIHGLVNAGDIETALLFATLKEFPRKLPSTMTAHWIEGGEVAQLKEAA
jgi:hypothetical protein